MKDIEDIKTALEQLNELELAFRNIDLTDNVVDPVVATMDIAAQERDLLVAFAKYTADINPGLLEKINAGHQKLSKGFRKHIELFVAARECRYKLIISRDLTSRLRRGITRKEGGR